MNIFSVAELGEYLSATLAADAILNDIWVEGEVANWSRPASGHCYWTLRQGDAQIQAVCWRQIALRQPRLPSNGEQVLVHGRVDFWPGSGKLQLYVDLIRPAGIGLLHAQVEALKQRLESEGLFDAARKRTIPPFPRRIGIVTSPTGAALHDMLSVLRQRWPLCEVILAPAQVQGEGAPAELIEALYTLYALPLDLIIVARGGGSIEDLWAFNDEGVARAIYASPVPVITGVGHETDTTVVDYVADLRAPTPSMAAAYATPHRRELQQALQGLAQTLTAAMQRRLAHARGELEHAARHLQRLSPAAHLAHERAALHSQHARLMRATHATLQLARLRLETLRLRLEALNPQATLARGYAIVQRSDGRLALDPAELADGERLTITLRDGRLTARVTRDESRAAAP
ncbi:exodeoxyribonuclease VII large subunit [Kallotenue papyrolyticum]|uniref:exodeoxyribonuclease VII large subunit n=1 Tax=Kallotenue papyrolyticum TaxID=1325125 RepID=UPI000492A019|nr:exodeoxyribonuclease VII large subunit [Kallotenue papyrolyticum]